MNDSKLYSLLAFAGASPFLAGALLQLAGIEALGPFGAVDELAASYGLAIVCFLAGTHWATFLYRQSETPFSLLIWSNVVFLVVWFGFVLAGTAWALSAQLVALLALLFVDSRLLRAGLITRDYFRVRSVATSLAAISIPAIVLTG